MLHNNEKPFICDTCDQVFRQKQLLKKHQTLYHNPGYVPPQPKEKGYQCSECGKSFCHKGNLIRHAAFHDQGVTAKEKVVLKLGKKKMFPISGNGDNMERPTTLSNTGYEKAVDYLGEVDKVNMPILAANQHLMNSNKLSGHELEEQEYSNAITYKHQDGQEYIVLEVMDEEDGEKSSAQNDLQSFSTVFGGQEEYNMHNAVSITESLTPVNNGNSLHIDNIVIPNQTDLPINDHNPDYSSLISSETYTNSNQSTNMSPNSFTSMADAVTFNNKPKNVGPSRFLLPDNFDFNSESDLRKRDLASCFGFDSDEE